MVCLYFDPEQLFSGTEVAVSEYPNSRQLRSGSLASRDCRVTRRTFRHRQPAFMHTAPCEFPVLSKLQQRRVMLRTTIGMGFHCGSAQTVTVFYQIVSCFLPAPSRGLREFGSRDVQEQELRLAQAIREQNLIGS